MAKFSSAGVRHLQSAMLAGCALASLLVSGPVNAADSAAASSCKRTAGEKSVYMRALQTDLMVAALTCNNSTQYNTFVHQFQPVLTRDYKEMTSYFKKRHGKAGATEMNAFVTHLANDESQRSISEGTAQYCEESGKLFTTVLALPNDQVEDFSTQQMTLSADAPVKPCAVAVKAPLPAKTAPGAAPTIAPAPATPAK